MNRGVLAVIGIALLAAGPGAQSDGYDLVPTWAKLPQGWIFGHPQTFPLPAERDEARAMQEKRRAEAVARGETPPPRPRDTLQPGVSGVAVDAHDNVYVLHRGQHPILVFDRNGVLLRSGGDGIIGSTPHFIEVDRQGNVWAVDEAAHRVLKLNHALDKVVLQIGVTNEPGHDGTHLNLPADIAFTKSGDILIADGYGNNRIAKFSPDGRFLRQWGGGPEDKGTADGQFHLPHSVVVDPNDKIYVVDRENLRIQMFDTDGRFLGKWTHLGRAWGLALSRDGKFAFITEHDKEQVVKFSTAEGHVLTRWGSQGRGPVQFDWAHGIAVDSRGAVYVGDTYGQRLQKFIPKGGTTTSARGR